MGVMARVGLVSIRLLGRWMFLSGLNCALALAGEECTLGADGLCLIAGLMLIPAGLRLMALKRWAAVAICLMWWLAAVRYHSPPTGAAVPAVLTLGMGAGWRRLRSGL